MPAATEPDWIEGLDEELEGFDGTEEAPEPEQPEEAEEPAAEEQPEEAEAKEEKRDESQFVPLATLLEERKKLQMQLEDERTRAARLERLEDELRRQRAEREQAVPRETKPEKPPVDYLEDPKGYVDSTKEELIERLKKLEGTTEQTSQAAQALTFERQVRGALQAAEQSFTADKPDYYDALEYVRAVKSREMAVNYPQAKPEQIRQALSQQEVAWGAQMLQSGMNPSEQAYKLAQALGYEPQTGQNQDQQKAADQTKASESGVDRRRLQGMGGGQSGRTGTDSELERLMEGAPDEFDQAMSELFGKRGR